MKYVPYNYQTTACKFVIENSKSIIMLDSGMGKTAIVLHAIKQLKYDCFIDSKVLVIAPRYVAENIWPLEIKKWDDLKIINYSIIIGNDRAKLKALKKPSDIYITNNETIGWLVENDFFDFDTIIIDELSCFKNEKTNRYKALNKAISNVKRIIGLTSEPITNNIADLWAEIFLFDGGKRLGRTKAGFYERYFFTTRYSTGYKRELKNGASDAIYRAIHDICLRNSDCKDGFSNTIIKRNIYVQLSVSEMSKYKWLSQEMSIMFSDGCKLEAKNKSALCTKLLQVCNGAVYDDGKEVHYVHNKKLDALKALISASNDQPTLIVYWFVHDKDRIKQIYPDAKVLESIEDFRQWNKGNIKIALMNPATSGKGIELQNGGRNIIWYSLTWSLHLYNQMNQRFTKVPTDKPVVISHIIAKDTLDEKIMELLDTKQCSLDNLLNAIYKGG